MSVKPASKMVKQFHWVFFGVMHLLPMQSFYLKTFTGFGCNLNFNFIAQHFCSTGYRTFIATRFTYYRSRFTSDSTFINGGNTFNNFSVHWNNISCFTNKYIAFFN